MKQRLYELATAIETPRAEVRKRLEALCSAGYIPKENVAVMTRLITFQHEVQRMILRDNKRFDSRMGCV
ncbi:MAG: hypothetical protein HYX26_05840 [Acidobacteriales bacterium]|nr:hypothetical protein [Terriglobales bacterium]